MRMVNIGPTIEQKLAIVSKVNDIQDEKVSIVADKHITIDAK